MSIMYEMVPYESSGSTVSTLETFARMVDSFGTKCERGLLTQIHAPELQLCRSTYL